MSNTEPDVADVESEAADGGDDEELLSPEDGFREEPLGKRTVQDGYRINVPLGDLGVEVGDRVDAHFRPLDSEADEAFIVPGLPVNAGGRITIPHYRRSQYGVDEGDTFDVTVRVPDDG